MLVTEFGRVTDDRPVQYAKAPYAMLVTELGIVTDVRPLQSLFLQNTVYQ